MNSAIPPEQLYIELYDTLAVVPSDQLISANAAARAGAPAVQAQVLTSGSYTRPGPQIVDQLTTLLGLYGALLYADPDRDVAEKKTMDALAVRYEALGRLNNDEGDGRLLFCRAHPGRPDTIDSPNGLPDMVPAILRVPAADMTGIELRTVRALADLLPAAPAPATAHLAGLADIRCANVPMLAGPDDVTWQRIPNPQGLGQDGYSVAPVTSRIAPRVSSAIAALRASDGELALIAEASLDDTVLQQWRQQLADPLAPASPMRWALVGTGAVTVPGAPVLAAGAPAPNRAVVLSAYGEVVWYQDKRYGFILDDEQLDRYELTSALGSTGPLGEHISRGNTLTVIDASAGRFAIAVCEDEGHLIATGALCARVGVTHLLVPVIAPAVWHGGWQVAGAQRLADELGVSTAVINSHAVERRTRAFPGSPSQPACTLVTVRAPHGGHVSCYSATTVDWADGGDESVSAQRDAVMARVTTL